MGFDFENAFATGEAFHPSTRQRFPVGPNVGTITEIDGEGTSSGGFPYIDVRLESGAQHIKDRLIISPKEFAVKKVTGLIEGAGVRRPTGDDVNTTDGRLSAAYLKLLLGKEVGFVVFDEEDRAGELDEYTGKVKMWARVRGYVPPHLVKSKSDAPIDTRGLPTGQPAAQPVADDDIPF
jgi:hypothetical protein